MALESDLVINTPKFLSSNVSAETHKLNDLVEHLSTKGPRWYEVGAARYRDMWEAGETTLPKPVFLPETEDALVPSRDQGRSVPLRVYRPQNDQPSRGVILHLHGGGFVLGSHTHQDAALKRFADNCQLTAISIGYRLAPEDPFPAGLNDCMDATEYLIDHAENMYGAKVSFITGESAGACLAAATIFHLLRSRPDHAFAGFISSYGLFDVTLSTPSISLSKRPLIINNEIMRRMADAYVPHLTLEQRKDPQVSPLFEDLQALIGDSEKNSLPPALFLVGSIDALLDDTLLMSSKWLMVGGDAVVKVWPGMPHGFTVIPCKEAEEAAALQLDFVKSKMAQ